MYSRPVYKRGITNISNFTPIGMTLEQYNANNNISNSSTNLNSNELLSNSNNINSTLVSNNSKMTTYFIVGIAFLSLIYLIKKYK